MLAGLLIAIGVASTPPSPVAAAPPPGLADVRAAIDSGRIDQARMMIASLAQAGVKGPAFDRLLADLAYASGNDAEALVRYRLLSQASPGRADLCERAAVSALHLNQPGAAKDFFPCAVEGSEASWRGWNAGGVLADLTGRWEDSDRYYDEALKHSPDNGTILNNMGYSRLMRGEWAEAQSLFARAAAIEPRIPRIANNLELARAAMDANLPMRRPGESDDGWAVRLNDAGVAAKILGDRARAVAAFTRALEASGTYYARAANNLESLDPR